MGGQSQLNSDMKRLLLTVGEYIKANADILDAFTIDHFVVPPFSNIGGIQRAIQDFGNEERLARTLDSLNKAIFADVEAIFEQAQHPSL